MLINENSLNESFGGVVLIMSDTAIIAASAKSTLEEIGKQADALGTGLQNVAPGTALGEKAAVPNSVQYLLEIGEELKKAAASCGEILSIELPHSGPRSGL